MHQFGSNVKFLTLTYTRFLNIYINFLAPYVVLDMNPLFPANDQAVYKDAIFFSGHKFVGGIQTPG